MKVIIAEKPDQGAKLAAPYRHKKKQGYIEIEANETFPTGALLTWAVGHLCELKAPEHYDSKWKKWSLETLPIIPERFHHQVMKSKWKQFSVIKSLLQRAEVKEVVIASDAGREGELIVRVILSLCRVQQPIKRLWISSLTKKAVENGFANLLDESQTRALYYEALSRSCADWLVGMNASRAYTLLLQQQGLSEVFSTGRVQTPTLALIVQQERDIERFRSEPFWEVTARFQVEGNTYLGKWHKDGDTRLKQQKQAEAVTAFCKGKQAEITEVKKERKEFKPPLLFNLSSLQAVANKRYKYSPKKTLDIAQKLYLKGVISYPRTDASVVTKGEAVTFPDICKKLGSYLDYKRFVPVPNRSILHNKRFVNEKKVTDHYAIIPTEQVPNLEKLTEEERKIYDLIVRRLLAAHYPSAVFDYTTIHTLVGERAAFLSKGKAVVDQGWREVIYGDHSSIEDQDEPILPQVSKGMNGDVVEVETIEGKTKPPKRFTEGELITLMKTAGKTLDDGELEKVLRKTEGLGTEATRAGIIGILKDRSYITIQKNQVYATAKGKVLIEALGESVLASPEMTAKWEQRLYDIGQGAASPQAFMEQSKKLSVHLIDEATKQSKQWSFDAETIAELKTTVGSNKSRRGTKRASTVVGACRKCNGKVVDRKTFYGCSNYTKTKCDFTLSKKILGKTISQANIKKLLKDGETNLIKGFKKGDKRFDASLRWEESKQTTEFVFQKK
ncbi:DNA topoisomerase III [Desertibacillus haloalkaliphilus]|uniref:DNA topoisomerase III n=1 Tax=Desertibacillus haloalkaliphilus TaxID=1328930 RepID=UPI001C2736B4|nr:DNA topoisomerase III [Desertibacillus haloalkaliphilus]MBU8908955.1 DNA topoisomerase III [Desertibacillus haloalkaliphilus]